MQEYMVQYVASYLVEAEDKNDALEKALDQHQEMPEGEWLVDRMN